MAKVISEIENDSRLANRDEVTALSAMFLAKAGVKNHGLGSSDVRDFEVYVLGLAEAFSQFPASIGWEAIHGGRGVLAKLEYKPKPSDIVKFCAALMQKRATAKVMAQRHIAESKRRAQEHADEKAPPTEEQKQRMSDRWAIAKAEMARAEQGMRLS
jgi:hypothetical protein